MDVLSAVEVVDKAELETMDMGTGTVNIDLAADRSLFYQVLADMTGLEVEGDHHLIRLMQDHQLLNGSMTSYLRR